MVNYLPFPSSLLVPNHSYILYDRLRQALNTGAVQCDSYLDFNFQLHLRIRNTNSAVLARASQFNPSHGDAQLGLALCYLKTGNDDAADAVVATMQMREPE